MDTHHIHNLIEYLEELHYHEKATTDHTTLLLNCYAKLKDTSKLDSFIKEPGELKFDLDTAIAMCRQGGYFEQAAYLAKKHGETDTVVGILIEDSHDYPEALNYIWGLKPSHAYPNLLKYARVLLGHCPRETTELFIDYYTGHFTPKSELENGGDDKKPNAAQQEADHETPKPRTAFSSFVDRPSEFIQFLEAVTKRPDLKEEDKVDVYTTLFEMYLDSSNHAVLESEKEKWSEKAKGLIEGKDVCLLFGNGLLVNNSYRFLSRRQVSCCFLIYRTS